MDVFLYDECVLLPKMIQELSKQKKICKRCKTECDDDNGYPVCNYCLKMLDNWE